MCRPKVDAVDEVNTAEASGHLLSLTTNDVATEDIKDALLTANIRGAEQVRNYVSIRIVEMNIPFFSLCSKTFSSLYNWECNKSCES